MTNDPYSSGKKDPRESRRSEILEATEALLNDGGPADLSVRKIAEASDVSTQMIYTLFGGKTGLLEALYLAGFERLAEYLDDVADDLEPWKRLGKLGRTYRTFALDHPMLYQLMMARPISDFEPPRAARDRQTRSFQILEDAVAECVDAGTYRSDRSVREIADIHWAMVHGAVGLEIAGFYDDPDVAEARFEEALRAVAVGFLPDDDTSS